MEKYSIIIPIHNRQYLINKTIKYFKNFLNCHIYIIDSTKQAMIIEKTNNVSYFHLPKMSFSSKIYSVLLQINTTYTAVCAADDFFIEDTIIYMMNNMKDKNYLMGVGRYYNFDVPFNHFFPKYINRIFPNLNNAEKEERVLLYIENYFICLWGVFDSKTLLKTYNILRQIDFKNDNFIEIVIAITFCLEGKVFFTDKTLGIRERKNILIKSWGKIEKVINKDNFKDFNNDILSLSKYFNPFLVKKVMNSFVNYIPKEDLFFSKYKNNFIESLIRTYYEDNFNDKVISIFSELEKRKNKVVLYGAGTICKSILNIMPKSVNFIVDRNIKLKNTYLNNKKIIHTSDLNNIEFDIMFITILTNDNNIKKTISTSLKINKPIIDIHHTFD